MPKTKTGEKVYKKLVKEYGSEKGKSVFYALINSHKKGTDKWEGHKKSYQVSVKKLTDK
jgi:hypothetical protein